MNAALAEQPTDDQRWTAWKQQNRVSEARRKNRMRYVFAAVCFAGAAWLLSGAL